MKNLKLLAVIIAGAVGYRFLMWNEDLGLNAFIFAVLITGAVFTCRTELRRIRLLWWLAAAFITGAAGVAVTGLLFSHIIYYLTLILFLAFVQAPTLRSPWAALLLFPLHSVIAVWRDVCLFSKAVSEAFGKRAKKRVRRRVQWWQVTIIGAAAVVFMWLFSIASPQFAAVIEQVWQSFCDFLAWIIPDLSFLEIVHFLFNAYFLSLFFHRFKDTMITHEDLRMSDTLQRVRRRQYYPRLLPGLTGEYHTAVAGVIVIGALLLLLNVLDVLSVWVAVAPDSAPELSRFVHRGTYVLIVSVLLSISILLFCFRKNLNFYPRNGLLKALACSWVGQNIFLLCSTGLRNWHYVSEYGLTCKRIGVVVFLLMVCVSLLLLLVKIQKRKTLYHFFRMSIFGCLGVLVAGGLVNWDVLIASYNTSLTGRVPDYAYLEKLSYQTAPYILETAPAAAAGSGVCEEWDDEPSLYSGRVYEYMQRVEARSWKSFNLGDRRAVDKLKKKPAAPDGEPAPANP